MKDLIPTANQFLKTGIPVAVAVYLINRVPQLKAIVNGS